MSTYCLKVTLNLWMLRDLMKNTFLNSKNRSTAFMLMLFFAVSSCAKNSEQGLATVSSNEYNEPAKVSINTQSSSSLISALLGFPSVSRAIVASKAARARIAVAQSDKELIVDGNGSSGIKSDTDDGSEGALVVGVSTTKLLYDNGRTDLSIRLSGLLAAKAVLQSQIVMDRELQKVLEAYASLETAQEVDSIIEHYIGLFNEREDLVKSAVKVGVLSNSDYLELQSLKNETLSEQAQAVLRAGNSETYLRTSLKDYLDAANVEIKAQYIDTKILPSLSVENAVSKQILELENRQIRTQIEIQELAKTLTTNWQTSVSSPKSRGAGSTLFAGISMTMPIKDGGKSEAQIEALNEELSANKLQLSDLSQQIELAEQGLANFVKYYERQKTLLEQRKAISDERIIELELKLKTGRVDVSVLAKEFLASANTEIALERLNYEYTTEILSALSVTAETCNLVNVCKALNLGLSQ